MAFLTQTDQHSEQTVQTLTPQGRTTLIDDPTRTLDIRQLKQSLLLHWKLMFTRSLFKTADIEVQQPLPDDMAELVDASVIRCTATRQMCTIDAQDLRRGHALIESGKARGMIVLAGF